MALYCSNCGKAYKNGEKCGTCRKPLSARITCIKLAIGSEHFCSKRCAGKKITEASYMPIGAVCGKCKYAWSLPKEVKYPVSCPKCEAPYALPIDPRLM
jgi:hypothetical protein